MTTVFVRREPEDLFQKNLVKFCSFRLFVGIFLFAVGFYEPPLLGGDLKWEQTTIESKAMAVDKAVEANFSFTNTASNPVEIRNISTSCGCTRAATSKKVYQPGESGMVKVTFAIGGRKGLHEKTILVQTSDPTPEVLTLRVEISDPVKVDKEMLVWNVGDPLVAQVFEITLLEPQVMVKGARGVEGKFEARIEEVEAGKTYRVKVTPVTTENAVRGVVRLDVEGAEKRNINLRVEVKDLDGDDRTQRAPEK